MSAGVFILILVVAIAALVLMIVKAKMHPVLALFIAALGTGIALGYGVTGSVDYISNGFWRARWARGYHHHPWRHHFHGIEDTGAAKVIANFFIKLFHGKQLGAGSGPDGLHHVYPCFRGYHHGADSAHCLYALQA